MITIIDYDAGNLKSVEKALIYIGEKPVVTSDASEILASDKIILPGVGAFGDAMNKLVDRGLDNIIKKAVDKGIPLLGICLGMQLLFDGSDETKGGVGGLSILPGRINRIPDDGIHKIPHMGWNSLDFAKETRLFRGINAGSYVYFVHSYYLEADNANDVAATTEYITHIHAAVERENVFGCQFHPEKSGEIGLNILRNFAAL
ncbi:MAG: imidazole glycerol phosphate synthase subunit HisH [Lachnospiraceae bacterium]|nr:imidazole glycerol phosphate synthase subunit HisH [Lachnospiraceae bacterium]